MTFPEELQAMLDDIHEQMGRAVMLRMVTPGAMNSTAMQRAGTTADLSVTAVREQKQMSGSGRAMVSDVMFAVRASQIQSVGEDVEPVPGWLVIDAAAPGGDTETWEVCRVQRSADGLAYELYCRTLKKS